ncbi:MAG: DUF5698 domain-containing protein, partial [Planctomycetota bacterium]
MGDFDWFAVLGALLVFGARIGDVSLGTIRNIYTIRGQRRVSFALGFIESLIFITAISAVLRGEMSLLRTIGYAGGFATGIYVGITVEGWIASGWQIVRVVARGKTELAATLREQGWAVTEVAGEGRDGPTPILFLVVRRKKVKHVVAAVTAEAPSAFVTIEGAGKVINGVANPVAAAALR